MLRYETAKTWRKALVFSAFVCSISSGITIAGLQSDPAKFANTLVKTSILFTHTHGFWINPVLVLLVSVFSWAHLYIGSRHSWHVVEAILKEQRKLFFGRVRNEPEHNHNVTLFMWKRRLWLQPWTWPIGGHLVPVAHFSDRKRRIPNFKAPINSPGLAEGIAGCAWQNNEFFSKPNLPNLNVGLPSNAAFATYAKETQMHVEWVRKKWKRAQKENTNMALSFSAWPIDVSGKHWGVLVIDSTRPEKISPNKNNKKLFRKYNDLLVVALEEV